MSRYVSYMDHLLSDTQPYTASLLFQLCLQDREGGQLLVAPGRAPGRQQRRVLVKQDGMSSGSASQARAHFPKLNEIWPKLCSILSAKCSNPAWLTI